MSEPPRKASAKSVASPSQEELPHPAALSPEHKEFVRLFWAARNEQRSLRHKTATEPAPAWQAARDFATAHHWPWAVSLVEACGIDWAGQTDDAISALRRCAATVPDPLKWIYNFLQGAAFRRRNDLKEAVRYFDQAVNDPYCTSASADNYNSAGNILNNLGLAYQALGDHDKAIVAYKRATDLQDQGYDTPGYAWHNLGNAYIEKGDRDRAIQAYRKALESPNYDTPGYALSNLGLAYSDRGDHSEAIEAFQQAIKLLPDDDVVLALNNLGLAYERADKITEAKETYSAALKARDQHGNEHARAKMALQKLQSGLATSSLSPDDQALVAPSAARSTPPAARPRDDEHDDKLMAAIREAKETQYHKYVKKPGSGRDACLSILRGWSSAVTLLEGSERRWRGGGYFIRWRGHGIVIDPGFDFLRNFHDAGYHGREISLVIVSHDHPDHNSDLKDIDDLRYELFKLCLEDDHKHLPDGTPDPGGLPYLLVWDENTSHSVKFASGKPRHRLPAITLASGFPQPVNLEEHETRLPLRIIPFKASHGSDVIHAMGFVIELLDEQHQPALRLGYTADTAYFPELASKLAGCDALIAHISQPSTQELQDETKLKTVHLGYRGTIKLLHETHPPLALIGEFWAGYTDLRIALTKGLRHHTGLKHILPTGLGMHLSLPALEIECTDCRQPTPYASVRVAPPTDEFGNLAYLCPSCLLDTP